MLLLLLVLLVFFVVVVVDRRISEHEVRNRVSMGDGGGELWYFPLSEIVELLLTEI